MPVRPVSTAEQVLAAATQEFVEKGFAGARVDAIAQRAGVNKATLYYQVGSKKALYASVMDRLIGGLADRVETAVAAAPSPADKLRAYILAVGDHRRLGVLAPVMMREVASGGRNLPKEALNHMGRIVACLRAIIADAVRQGLFTPANPMLVHMMVIGTLTFYRMGAPIRERIATEGRHEFGPEGFLAGDEAAGEIAELILKALGAGR